MNSKPQSNPGSKPLRHRPAWFSKRWVQLAVGACVFVGLLSGGGYWLARHHRPGLEPGEQYGIDVSHHQGEIDWDVVSGDGVSFAYIKATEGGDWTDPRFDENWKGAQAAGVEIGAYHFFTNCVSGVEQARNYLQTVPVAEFSLPPALDLEFVGQCPGTPNPDELRVEIEDFVAVIENEVGRSVMLYVLDDFEDRYSVLANIDRPVWRRHLYRRPSTNDWLVWQYSGTAAIDGIEGWVDLDVADLSALKE